MKLIPALSNGRHGNSDHYKNYSFDFRYICASFLKRLYKVSLPSNHNKEKLSQIKSQINILKFLVSDRLKFVNFPRICTLVLSCDIRDLTHDDFMGDAAFKSLKN